MSPKFAPPAVRRLALCISQASLLGLSLAVSAPSLAIESSVASGLHRQQSFDVPSQPLPDALLQFAHQAGLRLSYDSSLIPEAPSRALHGSMSIEQALQQLLSSHGVLWENLADGSIILLAATREDANGLTLNTTLVVGARDNQGTQHYDRAHLETMPVRQGQLTEVLRQHPAVQFDRSSMASKTPADLAPANISINGAKYWDNRFAVDGVTINNDINPGGRSMSSNSSFTDLPANTSQGMNLDISLLEGITVYDSNVPAEHGGFTGGVVDARTRAPSRQLSGRASVSMTKDSWTEYHLDDRYKDDFYHSGDADGQAEKQSKFRTLTYRGTLEGHLTDQFGLLGSFVRKQSNIYDQNIYASFMADNGVIAPTTTDLSQTVDNFFLKGVWTASDRLTLSGTASYAPQQAEYFNINTLDGGFEMESGGLQTAFNGVWRGDWGTWDHTLSWSELQQSRLKGLDYFKAWYYSADKNWSDPTQNWNASMEGTYGNIEQTQQRLGYDLKLSLLPFRTGNAVHRLKLGLTAEHTEASYGRDNEFIQANGVDLIATYDCTTASGRIDNDYCSTAPILATPYNGWSTGAGQMFKRLYYYLPGDVEVEQKALAAFIDDNIQWGNVNLRGGLRAERDDFMRELNIAPRLSLQWDLLGNQHTKLIAGANRYYGRNVFDYRLREGREALRYYSLRDSDTLEFGERLRAAQNTTRLQDLNTPYDDEFTLGIEQVLFNTLVSLRYVDRSGHDQIHRRPVVNDGSQSELAGTYYTYTNDGRSDSQHYYLTISPLSALELGNSFTHGELILSWSDIESSGDSYDDDFDDRLVMYKGQVMRSYERPVDNYTRPWSARLVTTTHLPAAHLTWSNFINWRASYSQVIRDGSVMHEGQSLYNYVEKDLSSALTWDTRIGWEMPLSSAEAVFLNLDIGNVLNRRNVIGSSSSTNTNAEVDYELGRNYTLEVGFRF